MQSVDKYCISRKLDDSQRDALRSALADLLTTDIEPKVRMVQCPPGTGKTGMLVTLISVLGCLQYRTLISASTNAAIIEVCFFTVEPEEEENLEIQETFSGLRSRVSDLQDRTRSRLCSPVQLRDVILVGSIESKMERAV